eukprot:TRINITY_DN1450_c1_g1_i1.p1 TRINITY_DN1450_c1_g1~~TRINITY_DN1450_c1_g1_i1.p1  ORF type:complete len:418 (-),score=56.01 TRINITY_DN1450_c1_g1_i1:38-1291(-)
MEEDRPLTVFVKESTAIDEETFWILLREWTLRPDLGDREMRFRHLLSSTHHDEMVVNQFCFNDSSASIDEEVTLFLEELAVTYSPKAQSVAELPNFYIPLKRLRVELDLLGSMEGDLEPHLVVSGEFFEDSPESAKTLAKSHAKALAASLNRDFLKHLNSSCPPLISPQVFQSIYSRLLPKFIVQLVVQLQGNLNPLTLRSAIEKDIAIAALLIGLFEEEYKDKKLTKKQSFLDLGCGLGVVTHILTEEGYPGRGIDIRSHPSWEQYPPSVSLVVKELVVDDFRTHTSLRQDDGQPYDWLIGNRSDELTPWIIYATADSPNSRFFLLPCCYWDFHGRFEARENKTGGYRAYVNYLKSVATSFSLSVEEGRLDSLSSNKRYYLVGKREEGTPNTPAAVLEEYMSQNDDNKICRVNSHS